MENVSGLYTVLFYNVVGLSFLALCLILSAHRRTDKLCDTFLRRLTLRSDAELVERFSDLYVKRTMTGKYLTVIALVVTAVALACAIVFNPEPVMIVVPSAVMVFGIYVSMRAESTFGKLDDIRLRITWLDRRQTGKARSHASEGA